MKSNQNDCVFSDEERDWYDHEELKDNWIQKDSSFNINSLIIISDDRTEDCSASVFDLDIELTSENIDMEVKPSRFHWIFKICKICRFHQRVRHKRLISKRTCPRKAVNLKREDIDEILDQVESSECEEKQQTDQEILKHFLSSSSSKRRMAICDVGEQDRKVFKAFFRDYRLKRNLQDHSFV